MVVNSWLLSSVPRQWEHFFAGVCVCVWVDMEWLKISIICL